MAFDNAAARGLPWDDDTDPLVTAPVVHRTGVPAREFPPPPTPTWAEYLLQAAASLATRSPRSGSAVALAKPAMRLVPGSSAELVLAHLKRSTDPLGVEGAALWVWFRRKYPDQGRSTLSMALVRLEALGLIDLFPSASGGNRKRYRARSSGDSA